MLSTYTYNTEESVQGYVREVRMLWLGPTRAQLRHGSLQASTVDNLKLQAQEVAQLAINAREAVAVAARMVNEARDELTATGIVQQKLELAIGQLHRLRARDAPAESPDAAAPAASQEPAVLGTVDMADSGRILSSFAYQL